MKSVLTPIVLLIALCAAFLLYVDSSVGQLPDRVATHFGFAGAADGWMSREGYRTFINAFGIGLPLFILGTGFLARLAPGLLHIPDKEYWMAPRRRDVTLSFIFVANAWIACLIMLLVFGIHYLTLRANTTEPAHLPMAQFYAVMGGFLAGVVLVFIAILARFKRPPMTMTNE